MALRQPKVLDFPKSSMNPLRRKRDLFTGSEVTNLTQSWTTTPVSINEVIRRSLTTLRARSREQVRNNDYAKKFMTMLKTNVVGPVGFSFNARSKDADGTPDVLANNAIEASWKQWCKKQNCDLVGRQSFADLCRTFIMTAGQDGETLHRIRYGNRFGKYQFQIETLDTELLYVHHNEDLRNGNKIRMGIEYDSLGRAVAYHLREYKGVDPIMGLNTYVSGSYTRVPAEQIIHCYLMEYAGQLRGLPWLGTPLYRLNMLGGFEEAALVNARAGAGKMGFYKNLNDLTEVASQDTDGNFIDDSDPGSWHKLPPGVEIQEYDPTYPSNEFGQFVKASLRGIAAGLGVSYHALANDLEGVNYSSGRLGIADERDVWKTLQNWMIDSFLETVYERWLERQLILKSITINGRPLRDSMFDKYADVDFAGRRWAGIDPAKEAKANTEDVALSTKSRSQIIREDGRDPDQVWDEIAAENARLESLGIKTAKEDSAADQSEEDDPEQV